MSTKIKTCIVGNMKVGKTSIIMRIFENTFK
jgi:GTPase SAR1 family protein